MSMKVMTIVGTRPEIIKLSRVIQVLDLHTDHFLVHTGQNYDYELNEIFFQDLGIRKPNHFLNAAGETYAQTIGNVIVKADEIIAQAQPDAVLLYGDTNSCLSVISAKRRKIPIFHMEAGNRSFDQRVPEEINRKIVDHLSDINMPLTEHALRYLLAEGLRPETVIKIGSPMKEVLTHYRPQIDATDVLERLQVLFGKYFVVSTHREENVDNEENFRDLLESLQMIVMNYKMPLIVSTHPRTRKRLEEMGIDDADPLIRFLKPMGFFDYVKLQMNAYCVLSDSGTITEESSILNFPALNIRQAHERPEGMEEGAVMMVGLKWARIRDGLAILDSQLCGVERNLRIVEDYDVPNVSEKVVRIIVSYTDYINQRVWRK